MGSNKYKIRGILGTAIFHILLLFALIYFGFSTPLPLPSEQGVEVKLGNIDQGMGLIQGEKPITIKKLTKGQKQIISSKKKEEKIATQNTEEAPIKEKKRKEKEEKKKTTVHKKKPKAEKKVKPKEEHKINPNALYHGKSKKTNKGINKGETNKAGEQGKLYGSKNAKNYKGNKGSGTEGTGNGKQGKGISFSLEGRTAVNLPKPAYKSKEQGKIVVVIWVNKNGEVTKAFAGAKGTNISDLGLYKLTKNAALKAKFSPNPKAPEEQKGTITYNFIRMN